MMSRVLLLLRNDSGQLQQLLSVTVSRRCSVRTRSRQTNAIGCSAIVVDNCCINHARI